MIWKSLRQRHRIKSVKISARRQGMAGRQIFSRKISVTIAKSLIVKGRLTAPALFPRVRRRPLRRLANHPVRKRTARAVRVRGVRPRELRTDAGATAAPAGSEDRLR